MIRAPLASVPMPQGRDEFVAISEELDSIAERLDELIEDRLRTALSSSRNGDAPDPEVMAEEKRLTRARRSVVKASSILRPQSAESSDYD